MPTILRRLPFFETHTRAPVPSGGITIRPYQIIVWISLYPMKRRELPPNAPRFPRRDAETGAPPYRRPRFIKMSSFSGHFALSNAHEITSPFAVWPLTPALSPEYRGEGVIS